jgi:hypothetical protein
MKKTNPIPRLIKKGQKYPDFYYRKEEYIKALRLNEKQLLMLSIRINNYIPALMAVFSLYEPARDKQKQAVYTIIQSRLKEIIRRVRISMTRNVTLNKEFAGYWKFIGEVYRQDAILLGDLELISIVEAFRRNATALKSKR